MVIDKNVAYLGSIYPHHVEADICEIVQSGCTSINMTINEMDWFYYRNARKHIVKCAREHGLKVYINIHGFGLFASPIPSGFFQMKYPESRQIYNTGRVGDIESFCPACPNCPDFIAWLKDIIKEIIIEFRPDGVFWDEPSYSISNQYPDEWACRCNNCQDKFLRVYGVSMPEKLNDMVIEFRQASLAAVMQELLNLNKECSGGENILCLMPWDRNSSAVDQKSGWYGVVDWEPFIRLDNLDVFAMDPYWIHIKDFQFFEANTRNAIELAHKYNKKCQIWAQAVWIAPGKEEEIKRTILKAAELGADMVAVWSFRGEPGASVLDYGGDYEKIWQMVKDAYRMI